MKKNSVVRVVGDRVEKYIPDPVGTARKYAAVYDVGAAFGFVAPRVLEIRSDSVVLERILGIISIRELYLARDGRLIEGAIWQAGQALALLHTHLSADEVVHWRVWPSFTDALERYAAPSASLSCLPRAVVHGDFSFANVFVTVEAPHQIVIIDPCANFGSTFADWTVGPIYLDVGKMLACLEGQVPMRSLHRSPSVRRVNALQRLFIDGYQSQGYALDLAAAHSFAYAVACAQFSRRYGAGGRLYLAALYNRLRRNFPLQRKLAVAAKLRSEGQR